MSAADSVVAGEFPPTAFAYIQGRITTPSGLPIQSAQVSVDGKDSLGNYFSWGGMPSDSLGHYTHQIGGMTPYRRGPRPVEVTVKATYRSNDAVPISQAHRVTVYFSALGFRQDTVHVDFQIIKR